MNLISLYRKLKGSDLVHFLENGKTFSDKATLLMLRKYFQSHSSLTCNFKKTFEAWEKLKFPSSNLKCLHELKFSFSEKAKKIGSYHPLDLTFTK